MMHKYLYCFLCVLSMMRVSWAAPGNTAIEFMTEDYPPYNFKDSKGLPTGMVVDILMEIFKRLEIQKKKEDIRFYPWDRAYVSAQQSGKENVLFSMARTPEREMLFKWVGPVVTLGQVIFMRTESKLPVTAEDLKKYRYAVVRGDVGEIKLKQLGVPEENISTFNRFQQIVSTVELGRLDAFVYGEGSALWLIKQKGMSTDAFKVVYAFQPVDGVYYAFNRTIDDATVEAYQKALEAIQKDAVFMKGIRQYIQ